MPFPRLRWCLLTVAALAMLAGASGQLSPALSTALWLPSLLLLACDPSSPVRRAVARGLHIPVDSWAGRGGVGEEHGEMRDF